MKRITHILLLLMMAINMECPAQTVSGKIKGHDYVDLGLPSGLKWATSDLSYEYFAWGHVKGGGYFSCDYYKWCKRKSNEPIKLEEGNDIDLFRLTKYGKMDGKTRLKAADDAATVLWGAPWRMPTAEELQELYDGCRWEYIHTFTNPRTIGFKGTSKYNGATILLPVGPEGGRIDSIEDDFMTIEWSSISASLWSSSRASTEWDAQCLVLTYDFKEKEIMSGWVYSETRYCGMPIRAVSR